MIQKFIKIVQSILIIALSIILLINLYFAVSTLVLGEKLPTLFGYSQAKVLSGSMEPVFSAGDMLVFKDKESYEVNDIVIFSQGNAFVTHRIVGEENGGFITKGDANNVEDKELLKEENIKGEVVLIIPNIGQLLEFLKTPLGLLLLFITGLLLIEIPRIIDTKRKKVDL